MSLPNNRNFLANGRDFKDRDLNPAMLGHHNHYLPGTAFDKDGQEGQKVVLTTEFDYDAVDRNEPGMDSQKAKRELFMLFGSMWAEVLEWVHKPKNARLVGLRFKAVIYCCRPQMLGDNTMQKIAEAEGITKQTFQDLTQKFRDRFNVMTRGMRSEQAREKMRQAALQIHAEKRKKPR